MAKRRTGLHKELSEILNGVSMPKGNDAERPSGTPTPELIDYVIPKPLAPDSQIPLTPKPPSPIWTLTKAIPPEAVEKLRQQQAKGVGNAKIFRQISWQIFRSRTPRL